MSKEEPLNNVIKDLEEKIKKIDGSIKNHKDVIERINTLKKSESEDNLNKLFNNKHTQDIFNLINSKYSKDEKFKSLVKDMNENLKNKSNVDKTIIINQTLIEIIKKIKEDYQTNVDKIKKILLGNEAYEATKDLLEKREKK